MWRFAYAPMILAAGAALLSGCSSSPKGATRTALPAPSSQADSSAATSSTAATITPPARTVSTATVRPTRTDQVPATRPVAAPTVCTGHDMTLTTAQGGGGHAGSADFLLVFNNLGSTPCVMQGYPRVVAVHLGRVVSQAQPVRWPTPPVTLAAHGGRSAADLNVWNLPLRASSAPCTHTTNVVLQVTTPGAVNVLTLAEPYFSTCDEQIRAVQPFPR